MRIALDEIFGPVACLIPIGFVLGRHEPRLRPGALAHLRFFPGAPGTPPGWLMGCSPFYTVAANGGSRCS